LVPFLGRWDDLLCFETKEFTEKAFYMIKEALDDKNALCAKWMPRKGDKAVALRKFFKMSPKQYRQLIVSLTNVVETKMCAKEWDSINFEQVPSLAAARYQKAFNKNAYEAYSEYQRKLQSGEAKVSSGAVFPYDVIKSIKMGGSEEVANAQWESLPNYVGTASILPMVDVSGSMLCSAGNNHNLSCLDVALSLGIYLADKNKGHLNGIYLTFSERPSLHKLPEGSLSQKIKSMSSSNWGMNTNISSAFNRLLDFAKKNEIHPSEMPSTIIILSDMQFDRCCNRSNLTAIESIRRKYVECNYVIPQVVFWNLSSYENCPVTVNSYGVALVSGFSPSIMKSILGCESFNPKDIMNKAISSERYNF
jgi:hypothetical protein